MEQIIPDISIHGNPSNIYFGKINNTDLAWCITFDIYSKFMLINMDSNKTIYSQDKVDYIQLIKNRSNITISCKNRDSLSISDTPWSESGTKPNDVIERICDIKKYDANFILINNTKGISVIYDIKKKKVLTELNYNDNSNRSQSIINNVFYYEHESNKCTNDYIIINSNIKTYNGSHSYSSQTVIYERNNDLKEIDFKIGFEINGSNNQYNYTNFANYSYMNYPFFTITRNKEIIIYNILSYDILCILQGTFVGWIDNNVIYYNGTDNNYKTHLKKIKVKKDDCCICFNKINDKYALIPCGHTNVCFNCLDKENINKCPTCRKKIERKIKLF